MFAGVKVLEPILLHLFFILYNGVIVLRGMLSRGISARGFVTGGM